MRAAVIKVAAAWLAVGLVAPAWAVGLGPLTASGATSTDKKGFFLSLINPYHSRERFRLYAIGWDDEAPAERVRLPSSEFLLGAGSQRQVLVVSTGIEPGEEYRFRVCAERVPSESGVVINARVCSKLRARRLR